MNEFEVVNCGEVNFTTSGLTTETRGAWEETSPWEVAVKTEVPTPFVLSEVETKFFPAGIFSEM